MAKGVRSASRAVLRSGESDGVAVREWRRLPVAESHWPRTSSPSISPRARTVITALLAVVTTVLFAPDARAGLRFQPPQPLSPAGEDAFDPRLAVDSQGRATVVWGISNGPTQLIRLDADGSRSPVQDLGAIGSPQLAVEPSGRATLVWSNSGPPFPIVQWRRISAEGIPGTTGALPGNGHGPRVAVDPQGRATVTWQAFGGSNIDMELIQTLRLGAGGTPGPIHTLAEVPMLGAVTGVAVDPQGRSTVAWEPPPQAVQLAPDGASGPVHTLASPGAEMARNPQVAVDRFGRATVVWEERTGAHKTVTVRAIRLGADGNAGAYQLAKRGKASSTRVAVDAKGRATVVWQRKLHGDSRIQAVRLGADGAPGKLITISRAQSYRPQVAVEPKGLAIVVWERAWDRDSGIQGRRIGADGTPRPVQTLTRGRDDVFPGGEVAVDPEGRPTVVWKQSYDGSTGPGYRIHYTRGRDRR